MAGIHADTDDDNFQSGSAEQVDTAYAFAKWYSGNKEKLMDLTRVSEFNSGVMSALEQAFLAGMAQQRTRETHIDGGQILHVMDQSGKVIRTITMPVGSTLSVNGLL
jgi:hypothetical protein